MPLLNIQYSQYYNFWINRLKIIELIGEMMNSIIIAIMKNIVR